ncbi:MAG: PD-(D/E)XK nuclease family protein [Chloroflexi bacterium]|nr:PD-(D/E)XK nuclease family protein [Chloroflexota bacterium]
MRACRFFPPPVTPYNICAMFRLSPLRLRVFRTCKLRYKYQYVDKVPARLRPQDTAGTCVHNVLCEFFARVPAEERTKERLQAMFDERWSKLSPRYLRMPGVDELGRRARQQLEAFGERQDLKAHPFLIEAYFEARLAPDVLLFGRMDRVDEEPDGSLHVIDYKTGAQPEEVDAAQIRLYAIMVQEELERPVARASFWYLDDGFEWSTEISQADHRRAREEALALARQMEQPGDYPPTIAEHCGHCPYLHACEYRDEIAQRRQAEGW